MADIDSAADLSRLKIERVPIDSIQPNAYNPNRMTDQQFDLLLASMRADGFTQPIVVQETGRVIVDGEHRWRAARTLNYTQVPVVFVNMSQEQQYRATLQHNWARGNEDYSLSSLIMKDLVEDIGADALTFELNISLDDLQLELQANLPDVSFKELFPDEFGDDGIPAEAIDLLRQAEKDAVTQAATEESSMRKLDTDLYYISFTYTKEEGEIVKRAMSAVDGSLPKAFLGLCQMAVDQGW